ncbi:MAG: transposase [Aphanocapsa lilacina HA4352-LM1]|nr:transposase [Aphanocapsa lilacina HA4352-LM1]
MNRLECESSSRPHREEDHEEKSVHHRADDGAPHRFANAILNEGQAGATVTELCRRHGISEQTDYRWKAKYGGMELSEAQRLKDLEDENRKLKQLVANQALDIHALGAVLSKKF